MPVGGIWDTERYYLRMLLHKSGAVGFDKLKTARGILCETAPSYTFAEINILLKTYGLSLKKLKLPDISIPTDIPLMFFSDILLEQSRANKNKETFNTKQRILFEPV
ncbi:hypothetical protein AVEN_238585-1 [Araneus ventricosus]|uniref:Uncharacterized protein n=1 Tax=Araneus ventricosus TaxID=182803 RepID=A0A4Y2HB76_ARAVE|nr:hypothetical protein AVEN_238585-1 [Araneus ventricosus]